MVVESPLQTIAVAVKEGLELWRTFIATRQQAYERKMDKRQEAAIRIAEESFEKVHVLFDFINDNISIQKEKQAEFDRLKTLIYRLEKKFNKYD